ncbi:hypothetical protein ACR3IL_08615 [Streptococcus iniae]|nr:hypothetical protein [Streptococcus iniae]
MTKWKKFLNREIRYILIFILTGIVVTILSDYFGIVKSRYVYHLIRHILNTLF